MPSCEEARPGRCVWCGAASRPAGGFLQLWGHGVRGRQLRGPPSPEEAPELIEVLARRYLCCVCEGTMTVVPRGVIRRRYFSAAAMACALALCGLSGLSDAAVRERVSPLRVVGHESVRQWKTLRRWIRAVVDKTLFATTPASPPRAPLRRVAERCAMALSAHAPLSVLHRSEIDRAFFGGEHMP